MKVSDRFVAFLASWEGERLEAYQVRGETFWTIGVGHTGPPWSGCRHSTM